jgi:hypothetical protein
MSKLSECKLLACHRRLSFQTKIPVGVVVAQYFCVAVLWPTEDRIGCAHDRSPSTRVHRHHCRPVTSLPYQNFCLTSFRLSSENSLTPRSSTRVLVRVAIAFSPVFGLTPSCSYCSHFTVPILAGTKSVK